jgi:golgi phosphoprotein 3
MSMLTLAEELLLLALRDAEGTVLSSASLALRYGLAGATLAELLQQGRLALDEKQKVQVGDGSPTGNEVFDEALRVIAERQRPRNLKDWTLSIGQGAIKDLQKKVAGQLVERGILGEEEGRVLWLFPRRQYPALNPEPESALRERVREVVLHGSKADERTCLLLSLIKACRLVNEVFAKDERREANRRIDELSRSLQAGQAVASAVQAVEAAVMAAVIASTAATSSSG